MGWWPFGKKAEVQKQQPEQEPLPVQEKRLYSLEEALQHVIWSDDMCIPLHAVEGNTPQQTKMIIIPAEYSQGRLMGGFYHLREGIRYQPIRFSYRTVQRDIPFMLEASSNEVHFHETGMLSEKLYLPLHTSGIQVSPGNKCHALYGLEGFPQDFTLALVFNTAEGLVAKQFRSFEEHDDLLKTIEWNEKRNPDVIRKIKKLIKTVEHKQFIPEPIKKYLERQHTPLQEEQYRQRDSSPIEKIIDLGELVISFEKKENKKGLIIDGRYALEEPLGKGGSADIYRAIDLRAGENSPHKIVAIKLSTNDTAQFSAHVDSVRDLLGIRHENLVSVLDVSEKGENEPFIVMDFVDGASLPEILTPYHQIDPSIACAVAKQVAAGLDACKDILPNLDVKPSNILLTKEGIARVTDVGIKAPERKKDELEPTEYTRFDAKRIEGTRGYIAPEVEEQGMSAGTHQSDMYSLGIVFYKMLIGHLPKSSEQLRELRPELPPFCDTLYAALTRLHPEHRWDGKTLVEKITTLEQEGHIQPVCLQVKIAGRKTVNDSPVLDEEAPTQQKNKEKPVRPPIDQFLKRKHEPEKKEGRLLEE